MNYEPHSLLPSTSKWDAREARGFPAATWVDIHSCVCGQLELAEYLWKHFAIAIIPGSINQNCVENHFSQCRALLGNQRHLYSWQYPRITARIRLFGFLRGTSQYEEALGEPFPIRLTSYRNKGGRSQLGAHLRFKYSQEEIEKLTQFVHQRYPLKISSPSPISLDPDELRKVQYMSGYVLVNLSRPKKGLYAKKGLDKKTVQFLVQLVAAKKQRKYGIVEAPEAFSTFCQSIVCRFLSNYSPQYNLANSGSAYFVWVRVNMIWMDEHCKAAWSPVAVAKHFRKLSVTRSETLRVAATRLMVELLCYEFCTRFSKKLGEGAVHLRALLKAVQGKGKASQLADALPLTVSFDPDTMGASFDRSDPDPTGVNGGVSPNLALGDGGVDADADDSSAEDDVDMADMMDVDVELFAGKM